MNWLALGVSVIASVLVVTDEPAVPVGSYFPLVPGATWVRRADDGGEIRAAVTRRKVAGTIPCAVIETTTVREGRSRVSRICYHATTTEVRAIETDVEGRLNTVSPPRTVLLLPPSPGKGWSWSPRSGQGQTISEEWVGEETVTVAAGTFEAWKVKSVTKRGDNTVTLFTWYAPGVGIVKIERAEQRGQLQREGGSQLVRYKIP